MLKDSQFAKDVYVADKLLKDAQKSLDKIKSFIDNNNREEAINESFKYEIISEKIVNNARIIPITSGRINAKNQILDIIIEENKVEVGYMDNGWFKIRIPSLLPKKEKGNPSYIRATLDAAMKKYFEINKRNRFEENCVFIVKHNYSEERSSREYRDHDNIELNAVMDTVALYVLIDDAPMKCRHYYCSAIDKTDNTEIFIVPNKDFVEWLKIYN